MHKAAILAKLIVKYPGLSKAFLGALAEKISPKVTEESQIEGVLTALEANTFLTVQDLADQWQADGDRRATDAVNTYKAKNPPKPGDPPPADPPKPADTPPAGETDAEKRLRLMEEKLSAFEKKEAEQGLRQSLNAKLKEKKIPEKFAKNVSLTAETDMDALVTELETDYKELFQVETTQGIRNNLMRPGGAGAGVAGAGGEVAKANKEEAKGVLDKII